MFYNSKLLNIKSMYNGTNVLLIPLNFSSLQFLTFLLIFFFFFSLPLFVHPVAFVSTPVIPLSFQNGFFLVDPCKEDD